MLTWFQKRFAEAASHRVNAATVRDYRGRKFEVFDGPMSGQWINYTGEKFRADENGPAAIAFVDYEYKLVSDDYSERMYYVWVKR